MEAKALHNFNATASDELSFEKGDCLMITDKDQDKNWYKAQKVANGGQSRPREGQPLEGLVPVNYIKMEPHDWFVGRCKRAHAEELLLQKNNKDAFVQPDGAFLIRYSESTEGDFSLSVKYQGMVQHFKILKDGSNKYFLWVVKFNSLNQLVEHHKTSSVSRQSTVLLKDMVPQNQSAQQAPQQQQCIGYCKAQYDFTGHEGEGEMHFVKDDVIQIIEKTDPFWWNGYNERTSETGLFPVTYVKEM